MALGKIQSINPDNISGTVLEDETEQVYDFSDPNFPNTGLKLGDLCTYDIDYSSRTPVASNLNVYTPTETEITTVVNGPITVNTGETLKIKNGGNVKGNINVGNGKCIIQGTGLVEGDIEVNQEGSLVVRNGGNVKGNINVGNGCALKIKNGGNVKGNINVGQANRLIIGDDTGGGIVKGSITINKIRKVSITNTSTINCG